MSEESNIAKQLDEKNKFSTEELKQVSEIRDGYANIQNTFGQIAVAKIRLEEQINDIEKSNEDNIKAFTDLQEKERNFLDGITKKYGEGTLNPETGVFTKNKSE